MERYSGALKLLVGEKYLDRSLVLLCSLRSRDVTKKQSSVRFARGATRARAPYCIALAVKTDEKEKGLYGTHEDAIVPY